MILSDVYVHWLLDRTLARIPAPAGCGAVLEGSIAEGFGNESSDIDFLLITDDHRTHPTMPSILFIDGRRVEVRTKSVPQVREQTAAVTEPARSGRRRLLGISEDLLNRCQRLAGAVPLRNRPLIESVQALLPPERLQTIISVWSAHRARQSMRHALALAVLRQLSDAANWARAALIQAAKAWVAARGETYLEPKWLPQQMERVMERVPESEPLTGRFWSLESAVEADDGYIRACADLVAELGVDGCAAEPQRVYVDRAAGVTTWGGVDRLHVVRDKQDVFALGPQAAAVWRSIVFARPLSLVVAGTGMAPARAGAFLAELHRLGLLRLCWRGAGTITPAQPFSPSGPITPAPSTSRPILGPGGALPGSGEEEIILLPLPARRFAVATLAMVWANMMMENAREDLVGALKGQQWRVAELTARRMLQHACRGILSAYGAVPLPPDSDVVLRLGSLADLPPQVKAVAHELDGGLRVGSTEEGTAVLAALDGFVREVRTLTGADLFPACFDALEQWTQALEVAYDWVRLGAYLNAEFPVDEGRDLLESRGRQPHLSAAGTATGRS